MFRNNGDGNCLFRSLAHIVYGTQWCHLQKESCWWREFFKSNRKMFEQLIIAETCDQHINRMACARMWGSHIEFQAAASLLEMPVFLCTTSQSEHQVYTWMYYEPFSPENLIYPPPPQKRPKTLNLLSRIEFCHMGAYHFDYVLTEDLQFKLIPPKLYIQHTHHHAVLR